MAEEKKTATETKATKAPVISAEEERINQFLVNKLQVLNKKGNINGANAVQKNAQMAKRKLQQEGK